MRQIYRRKHISRRGEREEIGDLSDREKEKRNGEEEGERSWYSGNCSVIGQLKIPTFTRGNRRAVIIDGRSTGSRARAEIPR